ncbi:heparinase II/III-like protein [Jejuia pallidilutea]|uniref:Heparinase II/III-like protein n=1 Tax=Jejuia pallidilutea TaxID=504487 RepID=A0A362X0P7_9FLAO|nr:heparinase II/III family protein [Jejuia pallidilutea]PQV48978.1 heparinase II/III-like protein [Jejuia pallidilutea]
MKKLKIYIVSALCFLGCINMTIAQDLGHPRIYITNNAKDDFLQTIQNVAWKKELVEKKKERLEKYIKLWKNDPEWLVSRLQMNWKTKHDKVFLQGGDFSHSEGSAPVPTVRYSGTRDWATDYNRPKLEDVEPYFDDPRGLYLEHKETGKKEWIHPSKGGFAVEKINEEIMSLVADAAFLYWLTGEKTYAEFAAPVFFTYIDGMHHREAPVDLKNSNQQNISGLATFEVIHEGIVIHLVTAYDFLYNYFKSENSDLSNTASVFQKWADQIIKNGIPDNNWNLFQARFLTYIALVLESNTMYENGKGREYYLDYTFNISTDRQIAVSESLNVYDLETGIWPESPTYSVHVITTLLKIFTLLDHVTNDNEISKYPILEKAVLASFQYLFPSGYMIGVGDGGHKILPPENFELLIANYRKYNQKEKEVLISGFLSEFISNNLYERKAKDFFNLFFYVDDIVDSKADLNAITTPTFYAPNISMFNQRIGQGNNALMLSTVGSYGNHAHANGISIELFANNYVLGPDSGKGPSYWHPTFRNYYARMPAHNTVIVDGTSNYNNMRTYHPLALDNCFPASGETTIFDKLTFSKVSFVEPETVSDQQRFSAIIKSNTEKAYVVDVFRSRKQKGGKQKHEYIYRNIGQTLDVFDVASNGLKFQKTSDLSSKQGDLIGYDFFSDKKKAMTSKDVNAIFTLKEDDTPNSVMKLWIKGSENQTIYKVKSPNSNALSEGTAPKSILKDSLQTLIVKKDEAAWNNPFAVVFNPYIEGEENPVKNVSYTSLKDYPQTQIIDVSLADNITSDRIIVNASELDVVKTNELYQKGLLSIIRTSNTNETLEFMFLSGVSKFDYKNWTIIASGEPVTVSIEKVDEGYEIQNNKPVTINIPYTQGDTRAKILLYENGKLVATRNAVLNRNNSNLQYFKLEKNYDKVVIAQ